MQLNLDDNLVNAAHLTAEETRLILAASLYVQERLSLASAAQFAGLDRLSFQRSLSARDIPLHYGQEDLEADLATVHRLRERDTASRSPAMTIGEPNSNLLAVKASEPAPQKRATKASAKVPPRRQMTSALAEARAVGPVDGPKIDTVAFLRTLR